MLIPTALSTIRHTPIAFDVLRRVFLFLISLLLFFPVFVVFSFSPARLVKQGAVSRTKLAQRAAGGVGLVSQKFVYLGRQGAQRIE
jgi:hypothetical protein